MIPDPSDAEGDCEGRESTARQSRRGLGQGDRVALRHEIAVSDHRGRETG